jgi:aminoglycoside 6'-N-acetyltransferase I
MAVERVLDAGSREWLKLRTALWPDGGEAEHLLEMQQFVAEPSRFLQLLVRDDEGVAVGLCEAALRTDYVNGSESSPVAFLEGLYVEADSRKRGYARALVRAVEAWALERGCAELASDAAIVNDQSHRMHERLGFEETERVVYFKKRLNRSNAI